MPWFKKPRKPRDHLRSAAGWDQHPEGSVAFQAHAETIRRLQRISLLTGIGKAVVGEYEHVQRARRVAIDAAAASDCLDDLPLGDGGSQGFKVWIIEHPDVDDSAGAVGNERAACFDMARLDGDRPAG